MSKKGLTPNQKHSGKSLDRGIIKGMWDLFLENKSLAYISRKMEIAPSTVARYRDSENWIVRRDDILKKAFQKVDANAVNSQSRQLNLARLLQVRGMNRVRTLADEDISANDARQFIKDGITLEREIMGEGEQIVQITIKLPAGLEDL